jgi:hypothetical protein
MNLAALHESTNLSYRSDCLTCHADIASGTPHDAGIFDGGAVGVVADGGVRALYHGRHIPITQLWRGVSGNATCTYECHTTVQYGSGSARANITLVDGGFVYDGGATRILRKKQDPYAVCRQCHGVGIKQLYQ